MPKWKDKKTGVIFEGDADGNPIEPAAKTSSPILNTTEKSELRAPTLTDQIFNYYGRHVPGILSGIGGVAGNIAGAALTPITGGYVNPVTGGMAGTAIGSGIGSALKYAAPQIYGEPDNEVLSGAANVITEPIFAGAGKLSQLGFPSARANLAQTLVKKFFPGKFTPEVSSAIKADPEFNFSVGQVNPTAANIENFITPQAKTALVNKQKREVINKITANVRNPEKIINEAQQFAQTRTEAFKEKSKDLYKDFEPAIKYNTKTVLKEVPGKPSTLIDPTTGQPVITGPTFEPIKIEGAIPLKRSKAFADPMLEKVNEVLGPNDVNAANIGETSGAYLKHLRSELEKISKVETYLDPVTKKPTATMVPFDQLKTMRDSLERFTKSSEYKVQKDVLEGPLNYLKKAIRSDIDEGVKGWGSNAYGRFRKAQDFWAHISNRLDPNMTKDLLSKGIDPETTAKQVLETAISDPQKMRQFISMGGRGKATELFRGELSREMYDPITGKIDIQKGINYLNTNELSAKEAVPSQTLGNAKRLLARASIIGDSPSGSVSPLMRLASGVVSMGVGAGNLMAGHNLGSSALAGTITLAGANSVNKFTEKVMFNPKNARIAAGLLDKDASSRESRFAQQTILNALRGARIMYQTPDGREISGEINNQGKVKLDSQKP